jgi:hypothetical protein
VYYTPWTGVRHSIHAGSACITWDIMGWCVLFWAFDEDDGILVARASSVQYCFWCWSLGCFFFSS